MDNQQVFITKLDDRAVLPVYASPGAAGADLCALLDSPVVLQPGETVFIPTGLALAIVPGYVGLVCARSGLSCKKGIAPANKVGVIDPDYRGELKVALLNHSRSPYTVQPGDRIAQLLILPCPQARFILTDRLPTSDRGAGGFGSTGT